MCGCKLGVVAGGGAHLMHATTCLVPAHRGMRLFMCVYCVSLCPGSWADSLAGGVCCKGAQRKLPRVRPVDHLMSFDFSSDCLRVMVHSLVYLHGAYPLLFSRIFKFSIVCTTLLYIVFGVCGYLVSSLSALSQPLQCALSFISLSYSPLSPSFFFPFFLLSLSFLPSFSPFSLLSHTPPLPPPSSSLHSLSAQTQIVSSPSTYQVVSMFPGPPRLML